MSSNEENLEENLSAAMAAFSNKLEKNYKKYTTKSDNIETLLTRMIYNQFDQKTMLKSLIESQKPSTGEIATSTRELAVDNLSERLSAVEDLVYNKLKTISEMITHMEGQLKKEINGLRDTIQARNIHR